MYKKVFVVILLLQSQFAIAGKDAEKWEITQLSARQHYQTTLECETNPSVGTFQHCQFLITYAGKKLQGATIGIGGGMPEHQHGLPTSPEIIWSEAQKAYSIKGLRFSMPGEWILHFYINGSDNRPSDISSIQFSI